ncbi:MAG: LuxR C-terminal-related transcriptional regulator [Slackia sp.]|nr:LuxR C-terminal-related transcriptional regulator [Slackia sp.]
MHHIEQVDESTGRDAARRFDAPKILEYAITLLGFGFCRAWIVACLSLAAAKDTLMGANWAYLVMGAIAALFIAFAVRKNIGRNDRLHEHIVEAGLVLATSSAAIAIAAAAIGSPLFVFAGVMTGGVAAGILQILWGERFCGGSTRFVVICSAAAAIVTALLLSITPLWARVFSCAAFPLASLALYIAQCKITKISWRTGLTEEDLEETTAPRADISSENSTERDSDGSRALGKLMFSIAMFSFLARIFDSVPIGENDPFSPFGGSAIFALVVTGLAFLVLAAVFKNRFDAATVYRISIPVMVAGLTALALLFEQNPAISVLFIGIGYEFFDILAWILFAHLSKEDRRGALYIYGLGVACMFLGMAAGILAGELIHILVSNDFLQMSVVVLFCIMSLVVTGFMVLPESAVAKLAAREPAERNQEEAEENGSSEDVMSSIEDRCASTAQRFGLTPRESEILVLLAKGRTIAIIARDLQIAKGTARTHTERIYRKLDVHKQQELIDLVERANDTRQ